jgi:hypothetical protein
MERKEENGKEGRERISFSCSKAARMGMMEGRR